MNVGQLFLLFKGGQVRRFHTSSVHTHQTNMHHGARCALIAWYLAPGSTAEMLAYVIAHDCAEIETGDIPSPAKARYKELGQLTREIHDQFMEDMDLGPLDVTEYGVMKSADYLETMLFCCEEAELGNRTMDAVFRNCNAKVSQLQDDIPKAIAHRSRALQMVLEERYLT